MAELAAMRAALVRLAESCHGDDRPECPIIENLAQRGALEEAAIARSIQRRIVRCRSQA